MNALAIALHLLAAVIWVGGLFFAYVILRPSSVVLEPAQRLRLWAGVFKRFFPWVWMTIVVLMLSGYWLIFDWFNGFATTPVYVHLMHLLGWLMTLLFAFLYYKLYPHFKTAISNEDWPMAAEHMNSIRRIVLINLIIGVSLLLLVAALQRLN